MSSQKMVDIERLHRDDAIYFPIVINNRHGIARYPIERDEDDMIVASYQRMELYYIYGVNIELVIFDDIIKKLDTADNHINMIHPDIARVENVKLIHVETSKLARKKVVLFSWLSYRAHNGNLIAYCSAPYKATIGGQPDEIERLIPNNNMCYTLDLQDRLQFITNQLVGYYM